MLALVLKIKTNFQAKQPLEGGHVNKILVLKNQQLQVLVFAKQNLSSHCVIAIFLFSSAEFENKILY